MKSDFHVGKKQEENVADVNVSLVNVASVNASSEMYDGEAGVTPLRCHAFLQQFPRLILLVVHLNATQQRIAVVPEITQNIFS